jgi:hypothetical protein
MCARDAARPHRGRRSARTPGAAGALALLALATGCAAGEEPGGAGIAARDARFVVSFESSAPASPEAPGSLRILVEPRAPWHLALEAPATLRLEPPAGLQVEPAEQRSEDAVRHTAEALEFASALRAGRAGEALVRGHVKFGMCEGEDTRCVIVRQDLELPLDIAFR